MSERRTISGRISREEVIDTAMRIVAAGDSSNLSMRRLARELGVAPMTLYGYVQDRDDLLDAVVDRLLSRSWRPTIDAADPGAWLSAAAVNLYQLLVAEPSALHIYLVRPVTSESALARMAEMRRVLALAGVDPDETLSAYATIHTYTIGFAALAASRLRHASSAEGGGPEAELRAFTDFDQFRKGLALILAGLRA
ncbi:MAG: TetR/AcrR family transcriptional regulator [Acidimicrobiales bacterium]